MHNESQTEIIEEHSDEIDLFELWATLVDGKWIVIGAMVLGLALATTLAFLMTPKYEAKVLATFADDGKGGGGLSSLAGQFGGIAEMAGISLGGGGGNKEASIAYLKSRTFLEDFITEKDLMPILYSKLWDPAGKKWLVEDKAKIPTLWKAEQLFATKILDVQNDKKTGLMTLTITWKDREQAVEWANELVKRANANLREKAIAESRLSLGYLEKELQKTSIVEIQNTIYRVMETQIKTMMMANTQEQYAFKVIDPAKAVDEDAFVQPKRPLMIALGAIVGLFLGVIGVFARKAVRSRKTAHSS